ncbi:MAG: DUF3078 domain-containing protein [bacterium]|nr:DUF3078 domain-containing protein [bacterium]
MNKRIWFGLLACSLLWVSALSAQDSAAVAGWKKSLTFDLTTAQTAYSDSWVGGEAGSFNWVSNLNGTGERQLSPKINYSTILKLSFGQTYTQDEETKDWSKPKKSTDLIDWDNMFRFTFGGFVDPYAAFRVESQFFTLHSSPTFYKRVFFRPTKFTESAGIAKRLYTGKNTENITTRLGMAVREVLNTELVKDSLNVDTLDNSTYNDGGFESVTDFNLMLAKQIGYVAKLTLYKAIFFSDKDKVKGSEFEDDWKAVDVNFENQFNVQVTKIVTVKLYTQVLYDKQVSRKGRFKETLGLGLAYKIW